MLKRKNLEHLKIFVFSNRTQKLARILMYALLVASFDLCKFPLKTNGFLHGHELVSLRCQMSLFRLPCRLKLKALWAEGTRTSAGSRSL